MALAKLNTHGVVTRGHEVVRVPLPKNLDCHAVLRLAELRDGWRIGYDFSHSQGGSSAGPSINGTRYTSRAEALTAGVAHAASTFKDWIRDQGRSQHATRRLKRALDLIHEFSRKQEPVMSATATKKPSAKTTSTVGAGAQTKGGKKLPIRPLEVASPGAGRALHDQVPPGMTGVSTTVPVGIALHDPDAARPMRTTRDRVATANVDIPDGINGQEIECDLALLHPHPDNRKSRENDGDLQQLAESIRGPEGLIQAITVRVAPLHWELPDGHYQIVCGERRWRACRLAGRGSVRVKIRTDLDDAATKRILAAENAHRRDLNPIEKAQLIGQLCSANADGSPPHTRKEAAAVIGLESDGAASNLVRLLELPKPWQERVAAGELAWTWAREIVPYCQAEAILTSLEQDWKSRDSEMSDTFRSRQNLVDALESIVRYEMRPVRKEQLGKIDLDDPTLREQLGVLELPIREAGKTKTALVATNADAYDELVKQRLTSASKAAAAKVGADEPAGNRPPTAKELREKEERRAEQLADHVAFVRQKILQRAIAAKIEAGKDSGLRVVLAYAIDCNTLSPKFPSLEECLHKVGARLDRLGQWDNVCKFRDDEHSREAMAAAAVYMLDQFFSGHGVAFEEDFVEKLAAELGVDLAAEWRSLQDPLNRAVVGGLAGESLLEEFLQLHRTDELKDLGSELGVHFMAGVTTKDSMLKLILDVPRSTNRRLPLPKSIKPLASGGKKKTTKGAKPRKSK
jgi:ParB/RepB/Spo0J family partition protein